MKLKELEYSSVLVHSQILSSGVGMQGERGREGQSRGEGEGWGSRAEGKIGERGKKQWPRYPTAPSRQYPSYVVIDLLMPSPQ